MDEKIVATLLQQLSWSHVVKHDRTICKSAAEAISRQNRKLSPMVREREVKLPAKRSSGVERNSGGRK